MSIKTKLAALASFAPLAVFAEGESTSTALDTVITNVQTGLEGMIDKIVVAVGAVIVAGLVFWGLKALVRWAKSYFGKG